MKKVLRVTFLLTSLLVWTGVCRADQWAKVYGEHDADWIYDISETSDGGYIAAGYTLSFGRGVESNAWLMKLSNDGGITWEKTFSGLPYDWMASIEQTSDGGYIMAGYTECFLAKEGDVWVIKLDSAGDIIWQWRYGGDGVTSGVGTDEATSVKETLDGGSIVAGRTNSFNGICSPESTIPGAACILDEECPPADPGGKASCMFDSDAWVLKLDATGDVTWQYSYGGSHFDTARSIQQTFDGGYILSGESWSTVSGISGDSDMMVIKLDAQGYIQWQKTYGDYDSDSACCVQQTPDGGYILAGDTRSFTGISQIWVLKLTSTGAITWQKTYGGTWAFATSLDQTSDGGYIVAGQTHDYGAGFSDIMLLKLDDEGNLVWQRTFGGEDYEWAYSVEETSAGGYIVAGRTWSFGGGMDDALILGLDASGMVPDCPIMGAGGATSLDTSISAEDSSCDMTATNAIRAETFALIDEPFMDTELICPLSGTDSDGDSIPDQLDNCPNTPNPLQEDTFPPAGNSCGDICECEGNFDGDGDVDGTDATTFKSNFGRNQFTNPCESVDPCNGDVDCDGDVDGSDASLFKADFGRNAFNNPCPSCLTIPWCTYL